MKKLFLVFIYSTFLALMYACSPSSTQEGETDTLAENSDEQTPQLTISPAPASPDFPDAILKINNPTEGATLSSEDSIAFTYEVTNYELGVQTEDANQKQIANSDQGQHIHLILNNEPYHAIYEPNYKLSLEDGHYVAISFLSRSYHESVKTPDAYVLTQFNVGNTDEENVDLSAPMLFYSRPKGTYTGPDTESVLFDFYLVNTELSSTGNQVKVTVNNDTTFTVNEWQPYLMEGLPMGENTIKIELVDSQGNLVDSPFNSEERTFTLEEGSQPAS